MENYIMVLIILFSYRIIKMLLFWIMSDKSAKRVTNAFKSTTGSVNIVEILKSFILLKNKGNPNDNP